MWVLEWAVRSSVIGRTKLFGWQSCSKIVIPSGSSLAKILDHSVGLRQAFGKQICRHKYTRSFGWVYHSYHATQLIKGENISKLEHYFEFAYFFCQTSPITITSCNPLTLATKNSWTALTSASLVGQKYLSHSHKSVDGNTLFNTGPPIAKGKAKKATLYN